MIKLCLLLLLVPVIIYINFKIKIIRANKAFVEQTKNSFETDMLLVISKHHSVDFITMVDLYDKLKYYDVVITAIKTARREQKTPTEIADKWLNQIKVEDKMLNCILDTQIKSNTIH